ncbi:hypothetical protein N825_21695 [Skermanella stibiiresistens SB22]|uniref:Uncharacterized protein n=1 Tax=Skermanella stibiiresistens SB22 TaxID=1385369 RepID=W9GX79_9PROT|nr:hypothetical protein [Skermanella stibiiresistens]EWY37062.1 hypothetical protein N825_21695 [Skermanella stibiiresistens SB22]
MMPLNHMSDALKAIDEVSLGLASPDLTRRLAILRAQLSLVGWEIEGDGYLADKKNNRREEV